MCAVHWRLPWVRRNPTSNHYRSRAGPRLLSIRPTSAHGTAEPFDRDRGGLPTLDVSDVEQTFSDGACTPATTASSAAAGGSATRRSRCGKSACSNTPRGPNSLVRVHLNSLVRVHPYRSRRGRPGPNTAARAVGPLQIGSSTSGGQPEGCLAARASADTHRAPASRFLPTGITAHSFPGNILGAPGSGARRGLRRNTVATRSGPTKRPAPKNRRPRCAMCRPVL
jgi:hypothetical protein